MVLFSCGFCNLCNQQVRVRCVIDVIYSDMIVVGVINYFIFVVYYNFSKRLQLEKFQIIMGGIVIVLLSG